MNKRSISILLFLAVATSYTVQRSPGLKIVNSLQHRNNLKLINKEFHLPWHTLSWQNPDFRLFPATFMIGTADSDLQTRGLIKADGTLLTPQESHWVSWQESSPKFTPEKKVFKANERQKHFKKDIALLAQQGANSLRFSINLSKLLNADGSYNPAEVAYYKEFIAECRSYSIEPMVCLYHHDHPQSFEALGAFEKEENIASFLASIEYIVKELADCKLKYWLTFNEPVGFAMAGYVDGRYPPGKEKGSFLQRLKLAGKVVANMAQAHKKMAKIIKSYNPEAQVGIAKVFNPLEPYRSWSPLDKGVASYFDQLLNKSLIEYFKTGHFVWGTGFCDLANMVKEYDPEMPQSLDFIGINYYTHSIFNALKGKMVNREDEIVAPCDESKTPKSLYPEGLLRAIIAASELKKPIFITEADFPTTDIALKQEAHKKYLYIVSKALAQGYPIIGYHSWSSMGCYSWGSGNSNEYGWFNVDFTTQERVLNQGYSPLFELAAYLRGIAFA